MIDPRRSAEAKAQKTIRSLSAPTYQVRNNRTCFLRKIFAVNNDDLSYLAKPPMGETNQTVAGQNKSAAKLSQKQVSLWYRERKYMMDKLDKAEDDVYERLLAIHKTKLRIEKARDASPDRSSISLYMRRPSRAQTGVDDKIKPNVLTLGVIADQDETPAAAVEGQSDQKALDVTDAKASDSKPNDLKAVDFKATDSNHPADTNQHDSKQTEKSDSVKINMEAVRDVSSPRDIKAQESARLSARPSTQANVSARGQEAAALQTDRAKTELGLIPEHEPLPATPKAPDSPPAKARKKPLTKASAATEASKLVPVKSSDEPKTQARRIEERILNEPFTYWTRGPNGKLVPSDVPYKRREFTLPDERDDEGRKRDFIESERRSKHELMKRFSYLCDDLQKLGDLSLLCCRVA